MKRFFVYQLANIYITVTAGSIFENLTAILDNPASALQILSDTIPTVVGYFMSLILTKILAGLPVVLLRSGALLRMGFLRLCFREAHLTQRELNEVYRPQEFLYGWEYPTQVRFWSVKAGAKRQWHAATTITNHPSRAHFARALLLLAPSFSSL